jgi:flagellar hook-length control protein FliK
MMAIETSQASSAHSVAVNGASHAAKGRGKSQDAGGGAGAFSSLLSGMGSLQADEDALAGVAGGAVADTEAQTKGKGKAKAHDGTDAGEADATADAALNAAQVAAAGAASSASDTTTVDQATGGKGAAGGRAARIAGMPGQAAAADGGTATAAGKAQGADAIGRLLETNNAGTEHPADSIAELVAGLKLPDASFHARDDGHTPTIGLAARGEDNPLLAGARRTAHARTTGFDPAKNTGASLASLGTINTRATAMADARDTRSAVLSVATTALDPTTTVQLLASAEAGGDGAASGRGHERQGGGPSFASGALPGATADPGAATPTGAAAEPSFAAIAAGQQLTPEELLAQQVNVLVTEKMQSAELKLDGFGDQPVEVSISLTGNEAQVAFRSDHAGARELLQGAVPHLKEMLQSEGLLLSGVSVGASGQGGAEAGGRQASREGGRGGGKPEPAAPVAATPRAARPQGVVDVFA